MLQQTNYQAFMDELEAFTEQLNKEFKVTSRYDFLGNATERSKYDKKLNDWLDKHANRRFTKAYYDVQSILGDEARAAKYVLDTAIREIKAEFIDPQSGKVDYIALEKDKVKMARYRELLIEKRNLASIYNSHGILKYGTDRLIAEEMTKYNEEIKKLMNLQANEIAFFTAKAAAEAKYGANSKEFATWRRYNERVEFTPEFWDAISSKLRRPDGIQELLNFGYTQAQIDKYLEEEKNWRAITANYIDPLTGETLYDRFEEDSANNSVNELLKIMEKWMFENKPGIPKKLGGNSDFKYWAEIKPSAEYEALLKQHGKNSVWYNQNHWTDSMGIDHKLRIWEDLKAKVD
jgi:hypothetical protein